MYLNHTPGFSSRISRVYSASPALAHRWYQGGDVMVHFANRVAEQVFAVYPDRRLQIYSYHKIFHPPVNYVKLHEMIELMLEYFLLLSDISENCDAYSNTWAPAKIDEVYGVAERKAIRELVDKILAQAPDCTKDEQARIRLLLAYWIEK